MLANEKLWTTITDNEVYLGLVIHAVRNYINGEYTEMDFKSLIEDLIASIPINSDKFR